MSLILITATRVMKIRKRDETKWLDGRILRVFQIHVNWPRRRAGGGTASLRVKHSNCKTLLFSPARAEALSVGLLTQFVPASTPAVHRCSAPDLAARAQAVPTEVGLNSDGNISSNSVVI